MQITGADLVIKALKKEKVDTLFAYPGGQVIDIFHSLFKETAFRVIVPRHEQGLIHAADGYARSTGEGGGLRQPSMTVFLLFVLPVRCRQP